MNTSAFNPARAEKVKVTAHDLIVHLVDGRRIEVPLAWFPRLCRAKPSERNKFRFIGNGIGIHWPKLDEDISVAGLLNIENHPLVASARDN